MTLWGDKVTLSNWLVDYLVTNIGCSPEEIDLDAPLHELGVGSRDAVVLAGELTELLGRLVSPVDFWQNPTITTLVQGLLDPAAESAPGSPADAVGRGAAHDPIAVIGVGCRLPGDIHGPDAFWQFLVDRRSAVSEVPVERWQVFDDGSPGASAALARTTRWGSFLADVAAFDAEYFDIPPSEADRMDPQQRLLLEVAVEALDYAGIPAESLRGSQTGVFAGACASEYGSLALRDLSRVDAWSGTGGALSIIANRLSYFLDLRGPSVTVDTACSSSLVAVHLASQSLRTGESDLAIVGGVNLLLSPAITRSFDVAEAMSRSGACRAFDAGADGFVRGEGCGVVVLKRLADAVRDGDRVLAVVQGSAVNQDGRSNGLMAPNPGAQTAVLRAACADAGIEPSAVDYVESHGTGTLLGDPIEARALGSVYGRGRRPDSPFLLGSVKTNVGHLEAAAGIVGFIKAALVVQRGRIPANLHFRVPNPHIPFEELRLKVVDEPLQWPSTGHPRRAGVSSFGFGGTNAHVLLEQAPAPAAVPMRPAAAPVTTLVVCGKSSQRVASWAGTLADWMAGPGAVVPLADIAHTLNHHRSRQPSFGTVAARSRDEAVAGLRALAAGESAPGVVGPHQGPCSPGVVFVYSGQGSQWAGMGQQLLASQPAFAAAVEELEPDFVEQTGFSLLQVLSGGEPVVGIDRIQPVLVAVQLALTALWRSYGIEPDAVIGHSMGEVTAAVVCGALSAADGLRVIATRSRLLARLSGQGAMALVELGPAAAEELVADDPELTVAVYASPRQSVLAGPPHKITAVVAELASRDRLARLVDVDVASHHPTVDPILPELRAELADLLPGFPIIPVFTTTAGRQDDPAFDAEYWADNLRNPVCFTQAVTAAAAQHVTFVEVSPHPLLTSAIDDTLAPAGGSAHHHSIPTLQRGTDDTLTFHTNLNAAHTRNPPQTPHLAGPHPLLPSPPWQHADHWLELTQPALAASSALQPTALQPTTLLGARITVASTPPAQLWQGSVVPAVKPYPGRHRLHGVEVVPASVLCETVLRAAAETGATTVSDLRFLQPMVLDRQRFIQVVADRETVTVASSTRPDAPVGQWIRHVEAQVRRAVSVPTRVALPDINSAVPLGFSIIDSLADRGVDGPPFGWSVESVTTTADGLVVDVRLPDISRAALLDAVLHVAALTGSTDDSRLLVPAAAAQIEFCAELGDRQARVLVRRTGGGAGDIVVDGIACAVDGTPCLVISELRYTALDDRPVEPARGWSAAHRFAHRIAWLPRRVDGGTAAPVAGTVAVVGPDENANAGLRELLVATGHRAGLVADARYVLFLAGGAAAAAPAADLIAAVHVSAELAALVRVLAARSGSNPVSLWVVTRGVLEAADAPALQQSPLWGLAGVIAAEQPQLWGALVDVAAEEEPTQWLPILARELASPSLPRVPVLALREGRILSPQLAPIEGEAVRPALHCRPDASYLITGGLGALGLLMASWLAERGARWVILVGRTALPPRAQWDAVTDPTTRERIAAIRALQERDVVVETVALDIAEPNALAGLLECRGVTGAPPIRGVIHAAGVTGNQLLTDLDPDSLQTVMAPKIAGAQALSQAFPPDQVDFLFLTASAATQFGIPGQGSYAGANAYLDALARSRHRHGGHTVSIDWVAWHGLGFAADAPLVAAELERFGSRPLEPHEAFQAWQHIATFDVAQAVVRPVAAHPGGADERPAVADRDWSQLPAAEVYRQLSEGLCAILARELRLSEGDVPVDVPFAELGLNSVLAMSIRRQLELLAGVELSATMLWNHPTVSALATYLTDKVAPQGAGQGAGQGVPQGAPQAAAAKPVPEPVVARTGVEPIAVIGIGCRFPGDVHGPDSYWQLLVDGRDAITELPVDRWDPLVTDAMPTTWGGFLSDVSGFDADFFGITPREAEAMDPQQRLLLEVTWEALEHAGIRPEALSGTRTAVMMGVYYNDYRPRSAAHDVGSDSGNPYWATGNAHSVTVGRIAYLLGLRGPAIAFDTACSSSLVALHEAGQSLRLRESDIALAGGVSLMLRPETQRALAAWGMFSPHGRCRSFDAGADGFVRGEGCGVVVLKRLTDALRDGDRVLAVMRGSAINQDGRSNGLTAPNAPAQRDVITAALRTADVPADSINYVETHGTATILGDPIEFDALAQTYGRGAGECALGAVKTNIGHLEAAAGIAGFIKATLTLRHGHIPPNLNFTEWNRDIDASGTRLFVPTVNRDWPTTDGPRRAAVSSFGFGGTNAHVVLEQCPDGAGAPAGAAAPVPQSAVSTLVVSAKTPERLANWAATLADWIDGPGSAVPLVDIANTLAYRRARYPVLATVSAGDRGQAAAGLRALARTQPAAGVVGPQQQRGGTGTVFVYSGQGSQWTGMGRQLLADEPAFAAEVDRLEPQFVGQVGFSLRETLAAGEPVVGIARIQPVLVGMQLALTALWRSYGIEPDAVIGHSMGEVTAAVVAGALSVADGLRVIGTRSRLLSRLCGQGAMALLEVDAEATVALLADFPEVTLAVYAAPRQTVVAGSPEQVHAVIEAVHAQNRLARPIEVDVASHHAIVDPVLPELRSLLSDLAPTTPTIPILSTARDHGATPVFDATYWVDNLRNPVRFYQAISAAAERYGAIVEISPHPVLLHAINETVDHIGVADRVQALATLHRDNPESLFFRTQLAAIAPPPSEPVPGASAGRLVDIAAMPWQHTRFWAAERPGGPSWDGAHPLLGAHIELPAGGGHVWQGDVGTGRHPWLADHKVHGQPILPGAAFAEIVFAAACEGLGLRVDAVRVRELEIEQMLPLADETSITTQLVARPDGTTRVEVHSRGEHGGWVRHLVARIEIVDPPAAESGSRPQLTPATGGQGVSLDDHYAALRRSGQQHGPAFAGLTRITRLTSGGAEIEIALPEQAPNDPAYHLHPVLFDSAMQGLAAALPSELLAARAEVTYLPVSFDSIRVFADVGPSAVCRVELARLDDAGAGLLGRLQIFDESGTLTAECAGLYVRRVERRTVPLPLSQKIFDTEWVDAPVAAAAAASAAPGSWVLLADTGMTPMAQALATKFGAAGRRVIVADLHDAGAVQRAFSDATANPESPPRGVVVLVGGTAGDLVSVEALGHAQELVWSIAGTVRTVVRGWHGESPRLWLFTAGGLVAQAGETGDPAIGALRGLVRVLAYEHPVLHTTLVDLDPQEDGPATVIAELQLAGTDDIIAWRGTHRSAERLRRATLGSSRREQIVRGDGSYLITGGLGGLGLVVARWLAERGAGRIILNGRSAPSDAAREVLADLGARTQIEVVTGDICAPGVAAALVSAAEQTGLPLRGVLHCAAVIDDALVTTMSKDSLHRVWAAKAVGALCLHQVTADRALDWWVGFSSMASLLGSPGQGAYACANAWLDALAQWRRGAGLPATVINWGQWADVGVAQSLSLSVLDPIAPAEGLEALQALLATDVTQVGVARLRLDRVAAAFPEIADLGYFSLVAEERADVDRATDWAGPQGLADLAIEDASQLIADRLRRRVLTVMGYPADWPLNVASPLIELGIDSLMAVRIRNAARADFGVEPLVALLLQGASLQDLVADLIGQLGLVKPDTEASAASLGSRAQQRATARQGAALRRRRGRDA